MNWLFLLTFWAALACGFWWFVMEVTTQNRTRKARSQKAFAVFLILTGVTFFLQQALPRITAWLADAFQSQPTAQNRHAGTAAAAAIAPPVVPLFQRAKDTIPRTLCRIYQALNEGNPRSLTDVVSPQLLNDTQKLDWICIPFAYRAHYTGGIVERPDAEFEVRTRVLLKPVEERLYVLVFAAPQGAFYLKDVKTAPDDWLAPERAAAIDATRKFVFAAIDGREDIVRDLVSPSLPIDRLFTPECHERLQQYRDVGGVGVQFRNYKGLKAYVSMSFFTWGIDAFIVDEIGGAYKIVKFRSPCAYLRDPTGGEAEDPNLEDYTLARFHLARGQ